MNKQQTFSKVVRHLASMPFRSYNHHAGLCAYRSPDGSMCAVGCLVPDELYTPVMEGHGTSSVHMTRLLDLLGVDALLAKQLQRIHDVDNNWGFEGLNERGWFVLECVALQHGLKMPELEETP